MKFSENDIFYDEGAIQRLDEVLCTLEERLDCKAIEIASNRAVANRENKVLVTAEDISEAAKLL
jgi:hypothetical protein